LSLASGARGIWFVCAGKSP